MSQPATRPRFILSLYVSGTTPQSTRALVNIRHICETYLNGHYQLEIIDILLHPQRVAEDQVIATPTLIRKAPLPTRRFIGDMSNNERIMRGLGLPVASPAGEAP